MATAPVIKKTIILDPDFLIPDGVSEFVYAEDLDPDIEDEFDDEDETDLFLEDDSDDDEYDLPVPDDFYIVSQTVRTAPGGQQVIDVVIEVEDLDEVSDYDIRVAKP